MYKVIRVKGSCIRPELVKSVRRATNLGLRVALELVDEMFLDGAIIESEFWAGVIVGALRAVADKNVDVSCADYRYTAPTCHRIDYIEGGISSDIKVSVK